MGQPQSLPQNKRASAVQHVYYDGSRDDERDDAKQSEANDPPMVQEVERGQEEKEEEEQQQQTAQRHHVEEQAAPLLQPTMLSQGSFTYSTPLIDAFQDHYSLGTSSTTIRFRSRHLRILDDDRNHQLVLEEKRERGTIATGAATGATHKIGGKLSTNNNNNKSSSSASSMPTSAFVATVKLTATTNFGMALARTLFTLPALFIATCTFCFCVQTILFLFMNIVAVETQDTWTEKPPAIAIVGATLAVPLLLYGLGSGMSMSWALVVDCWRGLSSEQTLLRNMTFWDPMLTEVAGLVVFAGVPLVTLIVTTLMRNDDWYELTIGAWAIAVLLFQTFYMLLAFLNEMHMCAQLLKRYMPNNNNNINDDDDDELRRRKNVPPPWIKLIQANVLLTQRQKYSGVRHERYLVQGNALPPPEGFSGDSRYFPVQWQLKWGSRWTLDGFVGFCGSTFNRRFFDVLDPPRRNYSMDEVFGNVMIVSKNNFSLQRVWCMDRKRSAAVTLTEGKGSVSKMQMASGHLCIGISVVVMVLALAGFLVWAGQSAISVFVIVMIVFFFCLSPILISSYQVYRFNRSVDQAIDDRIQDEEKDKVQMHAESASHKESDPGPFDEEDPNLPSPQDTIDSQIDKKVSFHSAVSKPMPHKEEKLTDKAFISVWESVRISEMKPWFCWCTAVLEVSIFFVWPFVSLYATKNIPVAIVFMVVGIPSVMRHYFNVSNLLQQMGPIDDLDLTSSMLSPALCGLGGAGGSKEWGSSSARFEEDRKLKNQALVATIIKRVTRSKATGNWIAVFFLLFFCVFAGFLMASTEESFDYKVKGVVFADDFYYEQQPFLPYPTCSVQKGFAFPGLASAALADYSFLATMAFAGPEEAQRLLDQWFGENQVIDDYEYVASYREATGTQSHPVSYKLFTIASLPDSAVISIRGSESMWDWMVDIQLWAGGVLAQFTKAINPFGWMWQPILDEMVYVINSVQSEQLKEVSYYRYTSQFINDLYSGFGGRQYSELRTTGASLGGGLAILTGAITGASAISISGLNAMYSRRTFDPPITKEQLNTRVFNVIPDRDIISRIDRPGMLTQHMQCRGPKNSLFACHSMWRSLCEIQYQCGSNGRPINCWCTSKYGYPVPTSNSTVSWEEACANA